jgi:hypothetical protein
MQHFLKRLLQLVLVVAVSVPLWAGDANPSEKASTAKNESLTGAAMSTESSAALSPALLGILVMKGVLTSAEANTLRDVPSASGASQLLNLLKEKGVVTDADLVQANLAPTASLNLATATASSPQGGQAAPKPPEPAVIPAVAPLRVLPIDIPKQGGLIPDIKLGSGASMKVYGFFKASAVSDTTSSGGATFGSQDWPLPLLVGGDTGPTKDPQVHIKARSFRIGTQAEWVPKDSNITLTGRIEGDFEADYTDVNNRNISSYRSSQFGLRVAWARLDTKLGGTLPWFAEFGQDWLLVSTTLPNLFETSGLGIGMGTLWERAPMFKTGVQFHSGDFKVQPEFAIVMPIAGNSTLTTDQRLRFGDRAGAESNQPGLEARVVFQFPLSHNWKGVVPAQIIFSGHHARMNEIIPHAAQLATSFTCLTTPCTIPTPLTNLNAPNIGFSTTTSIIGASNCAEPGGTCNLEQLFGKGVEVGNPQNVWTAEVQLPTPWVTFDAKFYRGEDMRFFFTGQLNDVFSNLLGMKEVGTGVSFSGRAITFGCAGGVSGVSGTGAPTVTCPGNAVLPARLQPVGGSGGFAELSFPLSRIFHANPEGHNSGWVLHTTYSTDRANYGDAQAGTNRLGRTDLDTASLTYKLNKWVTFVQETSYIVTRTANIHEASGAILPERLPFAGGTTRQAHNWRNEFGPVFTF